MKNFDTLFGQTPTFFKTAIITSAFIGLIFTAQAQNDLTASIAGDYCELSSQNDVAPTNAAPTKISKQHFTTTLKDLYKDQVALTHTLIQQVLDDSPKAEITKLTLLQNQENIASTLTPFYGKQATSMLTAMLYQHVVTTVEMVAAVRDGNTYGIDKAVDSWRDNGKQIAAFFNQTNPSLKLIETKQMVMTYLKSTIAMGEAIYKNNATADMKAYNKAINATMVMNNKITNSVMTNYPDKFGDTENDQMVTQK